MESQMPDVHPQQALAVYAESLAVGSAVAVFGDSSLGLGERLFGLGARHVHVWDPDPARARLQAPRAGDGVTVDAYESAGPWLRRVELAIVPDLAAFDDPGTLLVRVRDLVGSGGVVLVAASNREVAADEGQAFGYYELYDLVAAHFAVVTMVAELPFYGVALLVLGEDGESSDVSVDTQLTGNSRVAQRFVVVASQRDVAPLPYTVVALPTPVHATTAGSIVEICEVDTHDAVHSPRAGQLAELSSEVEHLRAVALESQRLKGEFEELTRLSHGHEVRALSLERELSHLTEANAAEVQRYEDILKERAQAVQALEAEVARRDKIVRELVDSLGQGPAPADASPQDRQTDSALLAENMRLHQLLDAMAMDIARREAEARAAKWAVSELEQRLESAPGATVAKETPSNETQHTDSR